jgi:hypothetical protein
MTDTDFCHAPVAAVEMYLAFMLTEILVGVRVSSHEDV